MQKKVNYALKSDLTQLEKSLKNVILESEDRILGELQKMREDDEAHKFSHMRINDEIQELQKKVGII